MGFQEDYDKHKADGSLLDPMPKEYVNVRRIAEKIGGKSAVPFLLGSGPAGRLQILHDAGVRDEAKYDKYFETWLPPKEAKILEEYAGPVYRGEPPPSRPPKKNLDAPFRGRMTKSGYPYLRDFRKYMNISKMTSKQRYSLWDKMGGK